MKISKILLSLVLCLTMILSTLLVGCNEPAAEQEGSTDTVAQGELVEVARLKESIKAGSKITEAKIEMVTVRKSDLPEGTVLLKEDLIGKFVATDMYAGEYFLAAKLAKVKPNNNNNADTENGGAADDGVLNFDDVGYVIVTDHVKPDTGEDVAEAIQKLIDDNPGRTLYFPDGEYLISKTITTSADPEKSVSLKLANFAHFKPTENWTKGEPLFKLCATDMKEGITNEVHSSLEGGIFDGNLVADGIWVVNAGNVSIRYTSIKYTIVGIRAVGDEDHNGPVVDVHTSNIVGSSTVDSIGVLLETNGSTLSNMRIYCNQIAIMVTGSNNFLRNLHPLYGFSESIDWENTYKNSVAFYDVGERNFYDNCYNDQFAIGFYMGKDTASVYDCCFNFWYRGTPNDYHYAFVAEGQFNSVIRLTSADFGHARPTDKFPEPTECAFLIVGEAGGQGMIDTSYFNPTVVSEKDAYADYIIDEPLY